MTSHTAFEALLVDEGLPAAGKSLTTRPNSVGVEQGAAALPALSRGVWGGSDKAPAPAGVGG